MIDRGATFDPTGQYRYRLWRRWAAGPTALFVMLNPSTADAEQDDPTVRRCAGFARAWGLAGYDVVNLFGYRSTAPSALLTIPDPIGPDNDRHILEAAGRADRIIVAWGVHGYIRERAVQVRAMLSQHRLLCLGTTANGNPRHPLYIKGDTEPHDWRPAWD